jgi:cardiolipin synthase A/B
MSGQTIAFILLGLAAAIGGLFSFIGLLYVSRGNPLECVRELDDDGGGGIEEADFQQQIEKHVNTALALGNRIELLFNGDEVYPRLWADLQAARRLITWHVFWFKPGRLADRLHEILAERARAGVRILFLYDHFGAWGVDRAYFESLRAAGVEVHCFRSLQWNTLYKWQQRSHTRTVVIDGAIGYTGGFAIHDDWQGDGLHEDQWRDTSVRMRGPAVHQLQAAFAADWVEATGQLLVGDLVFPECVTHEDGSHRAALLYGAPSIGSTDVERYFALTIHGARRSLFITNAYFVPDDDFRRLLREAVERGVDVRVLTPGANTDKPSTWYAGRCHYEELLAAGVRIYEYTPTMVHAKTIVADEVWSAVGTMNFDNRSMSLNDEVTVLIDDEQIGRTLHCRFLQDLEHARELELAAFRTRGLWERAKERFWVAASRLL